MWIYIFFCEQIFKRQLILALGHGSALSRKAAHRIQIYDCKPLADWVDLPDITILVSNSIQFNSWRITLSLLLAPLRDFDNRKNGMAVCLGIGIKGPRFIFSSSGPGSIRLSFRPWPGPLFFNHTLDLHIKTFLARHHKTSANYIFIETYRAYLNVSRQ